MSSVFSILSLTFPPFLSQPVPQKVLGPLLDHTSYSDYFAPPWKMPIIWCPFSASR